MRVRGANYFPADMQGRHRSFHLLGELRPQSAEDTRSEASKDRRLRGQPGILAGTRHQCHGDGRLVAGCNCLILAV